MSSIELKEALIQHIHQADDNFLRIMYAMMETYAEQRKQVIGYRPDGEAISVEQLKQVAQEGREAINKGEYKTLDDLQKDAEDLLIKRIQS